MVSERYQAVNGSVPSCAAALPAMKAILIPIEYLIISMVSIAGDRTARQSGYSSSQTSSKRQPLNTLLTIILRPPTRGCQQVANRR